MKLRISRHDVRRIGLNAAIVFSALAMRARKASLLQGTKKFFFCPVARNEGEARDRSYRPLTDVLPFIGEQTIRDCSKKLEAFGYLEVFRKGNRWDRAHLPSGKVQKKRTHRYHVPEEVLARHYAGIRGKNSYLVLEAEKAIEYGVVGAIVLNLIEYESAKRKRSSFNFNLVAVTAPNLAEKVGVSKNTVRRALKILVSKGALRRAGSQLYALQATSSVKLSDAYRFESAVPASGSVSTRDQQEVTNDLQEWSESVSDRFVPTGIRQLDREISTLGRGELAFLVGQTGHGKTITMLNFAIGAALAGHKSLVISLEMSKEDLALRLYSNIFGMECGKLRAGGSAGKIQLTSLTREQRSLLSSIRITEIKEKCTTETLAEMVRTMDREGYRPDTILIDQFSYLLPNVRISDDPGDWRSQKNTASDLAVWTKGSLDSDSPFSLWCLHQANGDPALQYGRESIAGCKAIIEPASLAVGIGHTDVEPQKLRMFSLKNRHGRSFELTLACDFGKMKVGESESFDESLVLSS